MANNRSHVLPARSPARLGAWLGLVSATLLAGYGLYMLFGGSDSPIPFQIAMLLAGALQAVVSGLSLRRQRAAWAFALSLNGTLAAMFLFGAPKVRDALDVSLVAGMVPAVAFGLITTLLALGADDYGS